ncbi:MAG TPA: SpoIIE family protein phosphatase [Mycobacteriales bacterium]|nr:SpoIIE family protein phosphatase [Mycobacteriales bacterium]
MRPDELLLGDEPEAVRAAREFVAEALAGSDPDLIVDAQLLATELVTNASLHGEPPILVRAVRLDDRVRLEVEDTGRELPLRARDSVDAMTGRGLTLVSAMASSWGVDPGTRGGKVVWAELGPGRPLGVMPPDIDIAAFLAAWPNDLEHEARFRVRIGAVPTELLLAAKAHIDNVVRELTLVRAEEASKGRAVPAPLAALIDTVTEDFAEARAEIKRQALAAAERGDLFTDLVLELPLSAADAGERYLLALDDADRHARAARLLTLAPPQSHRAFRQWYVRAIVDQLRAASRGELADSPPPYAQVLANHVDQLAALEESHERLQLLQRVMSRLTDATSVEEIASIVVRNAGAYTGVESARVFVLTAGRTLRSIAWHGRGQDDDPFDEFSLDADLPGAVVARTGEPLFLRSLAHIYGRFPEMEGYYPGERSLHVVPLTVGTRRLGLLAMTFLSGAVDDEAQMSFVGAIASTLASAIDRAQATARAEAERARELHLLTAQLDVLTGIVASVPIHQALESLIRAVEAVSVDGMLGSVLLLDRDGVHLRHGAAPSLPDAYNDAIDGLAIGPATGSCGTAAYRREQVIVQDVLTDPLWADFRDVAALAGVRACWSTPILGRDGTVLGTFAMYYPQPRVPSAADLALIDVLVRTVAIALERNRSDEDREAALAAESAAALTLQHSLLPAVPPRLGPVMLEARYRTGDPGVEVGGDWFDAIAVDDATVLVVGDVQGHDLQAASLMGQLRTVARAGAGEGQSPGEILAGMNHYLRRVDTELIATAVVVRLDRDGTTATVATAGHLAPLLLAPSADGWVVGDVDVAVGPPLAIDYRWGETTTVMPRGSVLLLYTDGLVETRSWPLDHGLGLLRRAMAALPPDADLTAVLDAALELVPTGSRGDDVAVLAASVTADAPARRPPVSG